jgi:hypothetical protein
MTVACSCEHCGHEFEAKPQDGHRLLCGDGTDISAVQLLCVEPDGMRQVGAEFAQDTTHPPQDEIALTAAALAAMKRKPRRPGNLVRGAGLPIVRFVPSKENPRTGFEAERALATTPNLALAHHMLGAALIFSGRPKEGLAATAPPSTCS